MSGKRQKSLLSFWKAQPSKGSEAKAETMDTLDVTLVEAEEEVREEETAEVDDEGTEVQEQSEDGVEVAEVKVKMVWRSQLSEKRGPYLVLPHTGAPLKMNGQ